MVEIVKEIETTDVAGKLLGQRVAAPKRYTPEILVPVARSENRIAYGITNETFVGYDTWNCYEISFLLDTGMPMSFVGKLIYPSYSLNIVESKSLKLYLNSFNMERMGKTIDEAKGRFKAIVTSDLAEILQLPIDEVQFHLFDSSDSNYVNPTGGNSYFDLVNLAKFETLTVSETKETPELLQFSPSCYNHIRVMTNVMRSNCRVTHQPDWATIFIEMDSAQAADLQSILKYIVSFRDESHFHEECVEMVYKRLLDKFSPKLLHVTALYTRRGGIDICPQRATAAHHLHQNLINPTKLCQKTIQQ